MQSTFQQNGRNRDRGPRLALTAAGTARRWGERMPRLILPSTYASIMHEVDHPVFESAFTPQARQLMIEEDAQAWSAVTGILFAIVTGGALLGIAAVLMSI
jgi:hypothetical protein